MRKQWVLLVQQRDNSPKIEPTGKSFQRRSRIAVTSKILSAIHIGSVSQIAVLGIRILAEHLLNFRLQIGVFQCN
jgi:hypothetical protein